MSSPQFIYSSLQRFRFSNEYECVQTYKDFEVIAHGNFLKIHIKTHGLIYSFIVDNLVGYFDFDGDIYYLNTKNEIFQYNFPDITIKVLRHFQTDGITHVFNHCGHVYVYKDSELFILKSNFEIDKLYGFEIRDHFSSALSGISVDMIQKNRILFLIVLKRKQTRIPKVLIRLIFMI